MASATPQRFPGAETAAAVDAAGPAAEGLELRKVNHRIAEVSSLDFSIGEATLHQHRIGEVGIAQISSIEAT